MNRSARSHALVPRHPENAGQRIRRLEEIVGG